MDAPESVSALTALGQRLRVARRERGMSQEALAQPEFTKSYVSAVERGKARPSLKALELMSRRLGIPMNELLANPPPAAPDLGTLEAELLYGLAQAELLITNYQADYALPLLTALDKEYGPHLPQLSLLARYRLPYVRALAHLQLGDAGRARADLGTALMLAEELDDPEIVERVRDILGVAFYEQGMPHVALEYHQQGVKAVRAGAVKDLSLRLSVYRNLANAYWALNDTNQAAAVYQEAAALLTEVQDLERQAALYWELSTAYRAADNLDQARLYARKALDIYETAQNLAATVQLRISLGEILTQQQGYAEAAQVLQQATAILAGMHKPLLESQVYDQMADLALHQDQLVTAANYAGQSLALAQTAYENAGEPAPNETARVYMRALRTAGLVAEREGRPAAADTLFQQAISLLGPGGPGDVAHDLEFTYAEALTNRGAHEQAAVHYRAALQHRQQRTLR